VIMSGQVLESPHDCPPYLYDLMLQCWALDPDMRPAFDTIHNSLRLFENEFVRVSSERRKEIVDLASHYYKDFAPHHEFFPPPLAHGPKPKVRSSPLAPLALEKKLSFEYEDHVSVALEVAHMRHSIALSSAPEGETKLVEALVGAAMHPPDSTTEIAAELPIQPSPVDSTSSFLRFRQSLRASLHRNAMRGSVAPRPSQAPLLENTDSTETDHRMSADAIQGELALTLHSEAIDSPQFVAESNV
jgi:hypothetical protein